MTTEALETLPGAAATVARPVAARSKRWRYWVDPTSQLPVTVLSVCATLAFIILFNVTLRDLTTARREQIAASMPALEQRLLAEDRVFHRNISILSGIFVVCVSAGMVFLTQRSSGPIRRIQKHLGRLGAGDLEQAVTLRKGDHFQALAAACNALSAALRAKRQEDVTALETLATEAEAMRSAADAQALAVKMRRLARARATASSV